MGTPWKLSPLSHPSLSFHCFISVTGACVFSFQKEAQGWVAWICQSWEQSPSRSWLPIVEAPGCLRHPTFLCVAVKYHFMENNSQKLSIYVKAELNQESLFPLQSSHICETLQVFSPCIFLLFSPCNRLLCRLTYALCLNFLAVIHLDGHVTGAAEQVETSFTKVIFV